MSLSLFKPTKRRIIFAPWRKTQAGDFAWEEAVREPVLDAQGKPVKDQFGRAEETVTHQRTERSRWNADDNDPKYVYVWRNEIDDNEKPFDFGSKATDTVIYVVGHGSTGSGTIEAKASGVASHQKATAAEVAKFLEEGGLPKKFAGAIKFYSCGSADDDKSFACQCASLLRKKGYVTANFFGYSGGIPGYYTGTGTNRHRAANGERASALRKQIVYDEQNASMKVATQVKVI